MTELSSLIEKVEGLVGLGKKGDDTPWRYLACGVCEAMGPHLAEWELSKVADDNDAVLIAAWNRRAPPPPSKGDT